MALGTIIVGLFAFSVLYVIFGALMWILMLVGVAYFLIISGISVPVALGCTFVFAVLAMSK